MDLSLPRLRPSSRFALKHGQALIISCLALTACQPSKPSASGSSPGSGAPVTVASVSVVRMDRVLPVVGTLFAKDEATLGAEVEGKVERTMAEFGDAIQEGLEIVHIDTSAYDARARQEEANMARAAAQSANAEANLKRVLTLTRDRIAAASDLDQAQAASDQAKAEYKSAEAGHAIARLNVEKSHVRAPFNAVVADRIANAGDYVRIGSPLFRVVNDVILKLIVQAPERYASQIRKDQIITFTTDAWPTERFTGTVFLISPSVNTSTRAFSLGALVQNSDRRLKANSFARGELVFEKDVPTVMVPIEAILQSSGASKVFVVQSGVAKQRSVQVGRIEKGMQEIVSGLKPGETVIVSGHFRIVDGTPVRIRQDSSSPKAPGSGT